LKMLKSIHTKSDALYRTTISPRGKVLALTTKAPEKKSLGSLQGIKFIKSGKRARSFRKAQETGSLREVRKAKMGFLPPGRGGVYISTLALEESNDE